MTKNEKRLMINSLKDLSNVAGVQGVAWLSLYSLSLYIEDQNFFFLNKSHDYIGALCHLTTLPIHYNTTKSCETHSQNFLYN